MYCTACGTQFADTANFCSNCGRTTPNARAQQPSEAPRRLHRLAYDKKIAGVCAGVAQYLDIDVTLVRILVVAGFFVSAGMLLLGYLAAWIIMPVDYGPARSTAEARATS